MRLASLVVIASVVFGSGCATLVVPPVVGAGGGALIAASRNQGGHRASVGKHALAGAALGLVVDAALVIVAVVAVGAMLDDLRCDETATPGRDCFAQ